MQIQCALKEKNVTVSQKQPLLWGTVKVYRAPCKAGDRSQLIFILLLLLTLCSYTMKINPSKTQVKWDASASPQKGTVKNSSCKSAMKQAQKSQMKAALKPTQSFCLQLSSQYSTTKNITKSKITQCLPPAALVHRTPGLVPPKWQVSSFPVSTQHG